jgi:hydrogenase maturation protease
VIIDATLSSEPEGTIKVIKPKFAKDFPKSLSTHELGLKDMIESAILLGKVPEIYLVVISINPKQAMSVELQPHIKKFVPELIKTVQEVVTEISG